MNKTQFVLAARIYFACILAGERMEKPLDHDKLAEAIYDGFMKGLPIYEQA